MFCASCGQPIAGPGAFCTQCGTRAQGSTVLAVMPMRPRVQGHLQTLGILWFVYGAYRAVTGVFAVLVLAHIMPRVGLGQWGIPGEGPWAFGRFPFMGAIMGVVLVHSFVSVLLALITGYGLTIRAPWGRVLAIITAIVALIRPITGTALGIYTLWVLMPSASRVEYEAISAQP